MLSCINFHSNLMDKLDIKFVPLKFCLLTEIHWWQLGKVLLKWSRMVETSDLCLEANPSCLLRCTAGPQFLVKLLLQRNCYPQVVGFLRESINDAVGPPFVITTQKKWKFTKNSNAQKSLKCKMKLKATCWDFTLDSRGGFFLGPGYILWNG